MLHNLTGVNCTIMFKHHSIIVSDRLRKRLVIDDMILSKTTVHLISSLFVDISSRLARLLKMKTVNCDFVDSGRPTASSLFNFLIIRRLYR